MSYLVTPPNGTPYAGLGLDRSDVFDVLAGSPIGISARSKRNKVTSGRYPPNFKLRLAVKTW